MKRFRSVGTETMKRSGSSTRWNQTQTRECRNIFSLTRYREKWWTHKHLHSVSYKCTYCCNLYSVMQNTWRTSRTCSSAVCDQRTDRTTSKSLTLNLLTNKKTFMKLKCFKQEHLNNQIIKFKKKIPRKPQWHFYNVCLSKFKLFL